MAFEKIFFCSRCGTRLQKQLKICTQCGFDPNGIHPYGYVPAVGAGGIGWSDRADDPLYARYQKHKRQYSFIFALGLILAIPSILFATGDLSFDSEGLVVTTVIALMFALIAVFAIRSTLRKGKDWEGVVEDKETRVKNSGERDNVLFVRLSDNRIIERSVGNSPTLYDYYQIGDRIKSHQKANLRTLEKYDKRRDQVLFCPSCATMCDARADYCAACGSPLLKGRINE